LSYLADNYVADAADYRENTQEELAND